VDVGSESSAEPCRVLGGEDLKSLAALMGCLTCKKRDTLHSSFMFCD